MTLKEGLFLFYPLAFNNNEEWRVWNLQDVDTEVGKFKFWLSFLLWIMGTIKNRDNNALLSNYNPIQNLTNQQLPYSPYLEAGYKMPEKRSKGLKIDIISIHMP